MTAPVFVDANLIVYSRDTRDAEQQRLAEAWLRQLWDQGEGRLSAQVLHEYYVTVTRKLRPGMPPAEARADVRGFWHGSWSFPRPNCSKVPGTNRTPRAFRGGTRCWSPLPRQADAGLC